MSKAAPASTAVSSSTIPDARAGSLYPLLQSIAGEAQFNLSYTCDHFSDLATWKRQAREHIQCLLHYHPAACSPAAEVLECTDCGDFIREKIELNTTPHIRVPAYLLVPKGEKKPRPAVIALHDHGAYFLHGKEKLVGLENEHPALAEFKQKSYEGRNIADELARRGYVVIVIDMFYWGERRLQLASDPIEWHEREGMSGEEIRAFNIRSSQMVWSIGTGLTMAGAGWAGLMIWDDIRTVDYLLTRPEVDPERIGCCGLSVGAYRAIHLAGLDERIKATVAVGWMCSLPAMLQHKLSSIGPMKLIPGLYQEMDLPDIASLTCPGALMCIQGSQDQLFTNEGVQQAYRKIAQVYEKAGSPKNFEGVVFDGPHEFNIAMQEKAFDWFDAALNAE